MRLDLSKTHASKTCAKPGCKRRLVYRHHRGGERTFVRHLAYMRYTKAWGAAYAAFTARYYAFIPEDLVDVCGDHHEEIHDLLEAFDLDWMVEHDCINAYRLFTWEEAMLLVEARKAITAAWLLVETPGIKTRRFTGRP